MGLLEKIGLAKKKPRPVGQKLEKGRESPVRVKRTRRAFKTGIFLILVAVTLAAFPRGEIYQYTVQVGDEWRTEDLRAPISFSIYKTEDELAAQRAEIRERIAPYFSPVPNPQEQVIANRDTLASQLEGVFRAYANYRLNLLRGRNEEAARDSVVYTDLRRSARLKATPEQWQLLVESYADRVPELPRASREPPEGPRLDQQLLNQAWELGTQLLIAGVLDVPLDSVRSEELNIRDQQLQTERRIDRQTVYGLDEAYDYVDRQFASSYENPRIANLGTAFFRAIFVPSLNYDRAGTIQKWQEEERSIALTRGQIEEGTIIIEEGQRVTEEIKRQLTSLERARIDRGDDDILWRVLLGQLLITLATYFIFFLYLYLLRRSIFEDNRQIMLMAILFAGMVALFAVAIRVEGLAMYIVPVAIAPILFTVVFDSRVGLFGALTLALIGGQLLSYDFEFTFATLFASTLGVFSVRDIRNRGQFFISAGLVFIGYLVILGATAVLFGIQRDIFLADLLMVGINSFLLIMAYPLLWVFERAFDITTDLSLLELSDTNRPLLKELSLRAPGTFNHSLQVANLAEAAADAIDANALLTRVGALYHDIGKMLKPEYFVENQRPGANPHSQLKPRMSALIIASHVKEGIEMGRHHSLPQRVLDFIPMHHGTTRIEFFYRKALDQRKEADPEILESEFRYPGPRPNGKETGILMLADSVEAASRSLSDPTHKRLETLIDMIFTARIEDGQLDRTDLTFRDLTQIKETFLSILLGIYHVRVKYPGQDQKLEEAEEETEEVPSRQSDQPKAERESEAAPNDESPRPVEEIRKAGLLGTPEQSVSPNERIEPNENAEAPTAAEPPTDDADETARAHREEAQRVKKVREEAAARGAGPETEEDVQRRAQNSNLGAQNTSAQQGDGAPPFERDAEEETPTEKNED